MPKSHNTAPMNQLAHVSHTNHGSWCPSLPHICAGVRKCLWFPVTAERNAAGFLVGVLSLIRHDGHFSLYSINLPTTQLITNHWTSNHGKPLVNLWFSIASLIYIFHPRVLLSWGWLMGKSPGTPFFNHQLWGFPVGFPINNFQDTCSGWWFQPLWRVFCWTSQSSQKKKINHV